MRFVRETAQQRTAKRYALAPVGIAAKMIAIAVQVGGNSIAQPVIANTREGNRSSLDPVMSASVGSCPCTRNLANVSPSATSAVAGREQQKIRE
jgi:hypothetical protein